MPHPIVDTGTDASAHAGQSGFGAGRIFPYAIAVLLVLACIPSLQGSGKAPQEDGAKPLALVSEYNYRNYTAIKAAIEQIADTYPDIARIYDIGDSWEKTEGIADRDILALKISDNVALEEDEPEVLIMGLHHAREWPTSELLTFLAENITGLYGIDARVSWLVDNRQIWLVPIVNPDGLDYALESDDLWRKNRRLNYDDSYGVDLNRNYNGSENGDLDGEWGGVGSSHVPSDATYCGEAPFSEPETQAIRDLTSAHEFQIAIDFHTYSDLVLWPWGYTSELPPDNDDLARIGGELAALNGYTAEQGVYLYPTTGDSTDWLYGGKDVFAYCIEVGNEGGSTADNFHPPGYDTVMGLIYENMPVSLEAIETAGDRQERGFAIYPVIWPTREYSEAGFEVVATITADRGVNGSALEVVYSANGGAWASAPMGLYTGNDTYMATIPAEEPGSIIQYYIRAEDLGGFTLTSPRYAPYELHAFEVLDAPDLPPTIYHEPRTLESVNDTLFRADDGVSIRAQITDENPGVNVTLHYRPLGGDLEFDDVTMVSDYSGGDFIGLATSGYEYGLEYYIEAQDDQGHITRAPGNAPHSWFIWYNLPPSIQSVLPDESSRLVGCSETVEVSVTVADDYGPTYVVMSVEYALGESYDVGMASVSTEEGISVWSAEIVTRSVSGTVWLNFTVMDGLLSGWLNGTLLSVIDPLPLEVDSDIPPSVDGSFDIVVTAVPRNATTEMEFRLRMARPMSLEEYTYPFAAISDSLLRAVIPAGSLLGQFTAVVDAFVGGQVTWSSEGSPVEVVDLRAPEMVCKTANYSRTPQLLLLEVTASDAYSVTDVKVYHRLEGQADFSVSDLDIVGSVGNESTWSCWVALPVDSVLEYYLVLSDGTHSKRVPDSPSLYSYDSSDDSPRDYEILGLPVWAFALLVLVEASVAVLVLVVFLNRAKRP